MHILWTGRKVGETGPVIVQEHSNNKKKTLDFNFPNKPGRRQKSWESQAGPLQGREADSRAHVFVIKQIKNFPQIPNKNLFTSVNKFQSWPLRAALNRCDNEPIWKGSPPGATVAFPPELQVPARTRLGHPGERGAMGQKWHKNGRMREKPRAL